MCCPSLVWQPPHSRHPKLPRLQHISGRGSLHGFKPQSIFTRPATGYSETRCCGRPWNQSSAGPDISLLRPELQRQWHHAKNQHLGDRQITTGSRSACVVDLQPMSQWVSS
ncbi:hypothetical protein WJX79_005055 [Trebouxia sp. C0005]